MAHAQRLQEEVKTLTARCEKLERQLSQAKGVDPGDLQHLLGPDSDLSEPVDNVSEGFGSLSIGIDGQAKYHGETSSSEVGSEYCFRVVGRVLTESRSTSKICCP